MKEIKFRRPHFSHKDNSFQGFSYWGPVEGGFQSPSHWSHCYVKEGIDQQLCGLQDKNGKEIYEGDVVKHLAINKNWEPLNDDSPLEVEANSVVEYKGHGFWLSNEYFGWEGEGLVDWDNLEVLGNIYENGLIK